MYFSYRSTSPRSFVKHRWPWTPPAIFLEFISFRHHHSDTVLQIGHTHVLRNLCFTIHSCFAHDKAITRVIPVPMVFVQKSDAQPCVSNRKSFRRLSTLSNVSVPKTHLFRSEKRTEPVCFLKKCVGEHVSVQNKRFERPFHSKTDGNEAMRSSFLGWRREFPECLGFEILSL